VKLFHYHLVTSLVRQVEARYVGKLAFQLVARHGRIGDEYQSFEPGLSWEELDRLGFKLRLTELERGAVNVVVQPGQWELPRVDHLGLALDEDEFQEVIERAVEKELRIQAHGGRRKIHPPREWLDDLLAAGKDLTLSELHLLADDPEGKATALAELLDSERDGASVEVGDAVVRFLPDGPQGRPQLHAELLT
jgi:hypothetical protein